MDPQTAGLIALGILALVALAYLAVFRKKGELKIDGPGGTGLSFKGSSESDRHPAGETTAERIRAEGSIGVAGRTGGKVTARDLDAGGDVRVENHPDPKV
ncbi:MAG: hypothetical protein ABJC13_19265 [Acidobacteriota bacterium]